MEEKTDNEKFLERKEENFDTPLIPQKVYDDLPKLLKQGCDNYSESRERDIFLTGALVLVGGCMPNFSGIYDNRKNSFNLYAMIVAPPASGKGVLMQSFKYVETIQLKLQNEYQKSLTEYSRLKKKKKEEKDDGEKKLENEPISPIFKRLIIPANSSSAAFIQSLQNSDGSGILFETEADTLSQTFKQEWGNFSDSLRKAFHNEPISVSRKGDATEIYIENPKLSVVISGTFDQVGAMGLDDSKNGLQSRFLFYVFESIPVFNNVSPSSKRVNKISMESLGDQLSKIYDLLKRFENEFTLNENQWEIFHRRFRRKLAYTNNNQNHYAGSMVIRLAVATYRIAGILSMLRTIENNKLPTGVIECSWIDLRIAFQLSETYYHHNLAVFNYSKGKEKDPVLNKYMRFLEFLPNDRDFTRQEAVETGKLFFSERTIDRRLEKFRKSGLLVSIKAGIFRKVVK